MYFERFLRAIPLELIPFGRYLSSDTLRAIPFERFGSSRAIFDVNLGKIARCCVTASQWTIDLCVFVDMRVRVMFFMMIR